MKNWRTEWDKDEKLIQKEQKTERNNIVRGAKEHIKSILVALKKYQRGSVSERDYALEHVEKLKDYYLRKL